VERGHAEQVSKNLDQLLTRGETDENAITALDLYGSLQKTIELMNHPYRREKILNNRDSIISGKSRLPTQNTLTTLMREEEKQPWSIWNAFSIMRAQKNVGLAKKQLLDLAPNLDINNITLDDIKFIEGSAMIAIIQSGGLDADTTISNAAKTILHAHKTFDYDKISIRSVRSETDIQDSIKLSLQAIQPMYNELLVHLNGNLGPTNRK